MLYKIKYLTAGLIRSLLEKSNFQKKKKLHKNHKLTRQHIIWDKVYPCFIVKMLGIQRLFQKAAIISSDSFGFFFFFWEDALQALFFSLFLYSQIRVCIADALLELGTNSEVVYNFCETNMSQSMVTVCFSHMTEPALRSFSLPSVFLMKNNAKFVFYMAHNKLNKVTRSTNFFWKADHKQYALHRCHSCWLQIIGIRKTRDNLLL